MEETNICNQCGSEYIPKRSDQKFCSLKCKNKHNNKKVIAAYHKGKRKDIVTKETDTILIKNRNILLANCDRQMPIESLIKVGLVLNTVTGFEQPNDGKQSLLFCYDYGYQFIDAKTVRIFKR